jgi:hypothetical protein
MIRSMSCAIRSCTPAVLKRNEAGIVVSFEHFMCFPISGTGKSGGSGMVAGSTSHSR